MKNKNGFSFIEVLATSGVLAVIIYVFGSGSTFLTSKNKNIEELLALEGHVNSLYENIQSNVDLYQISYSSVEFDQNSDPTKLATYLPMVWNTKVLTSPESCKECPGRMGFVIVPLNNYRGLYKLTVRATHPKIQAFKDYNFLINGK